MPKRVLRISPDCSNVELRGGVVRKSRTDKDCHAILCPPRTIKRGSYYVHTGHHLEFCDYHFTASDVVVSVPTPSEASNG